MLEVEGPTPDAGVASCLLFDTEPVFRRLRDDLFHGKILVGIIRRGGNELQKGSAGNISKLWSFRVHDSSVHDSSGCARHRSVYVCITVKGSRVCEHCNVLAV